MLFSNLFIMSDIEYNNTLENSKNINLKQNGRIFPNWIMQNFKKYVLPDVIRKDGDDPCNEVREKGLRLTPDGKAIPASEVEDL